MGNDLHYDDGEQIDWRHRGRYMELRHGISPRVAAEAVADPDRVTISPDYNSISGRTVRVIGAAPSVEALVTVIVLEHGGVVHGVNGWRSNDRDRRIYREAMTHE